MNYSDFRVLVDWREFDAAKAGDKSAADRIATALDGVDIYFHAIPIHEGQIAVTIADVICAGIIRRVTLHASE